jgi:HD-GYP domain-containing protein (c-di-GMP phosphodiesterase class II)
MSGFQTEEKVADLITRLARSIQVAQLYGPRHAITEEALDALKSSLDSVLAGRDDVTIGIIGDELAFEKEPLFELSAKRRGFIDFLRAKGVKKLSFFKGVERDELVEFNKLMAAKHQSLARPEEVRALWNEAKIQHIAVGDIGVKEKPTPEKLQEDRIPELIRRNYQKSAHFLSKTFHDLKGNQRLNVDNARQIVDGLLKNIVQNKNLLVMLTSMKGHDENIFLHGVNVAVFTLLQAEVLGLEPKYLMDMGMAALLHDIGKLSLPREMIEEMEQAGHEASLVEDERQSFQDISGAKILLESEGISVLAAIAAFEHSIRYDQSGAPRKLYGKSLNLVSMMLAISDYYDKVRRRPSFYEEGGPEKAYDEMVALAGKHFHPDLLENFFSVIGVYPPGTLVELDTGEVALVIQASMLDKRRPQVEIIYEATGERHKDPHVVNLIEKDRRGKFKRSIVRSISPTGKFQVPDSINNA